MMENKNVAIINDISGIGRCSLTATIPILSVLGIQCCPFPTSILSCQTTYEEFSFLDLTEEMYKYKNVWDKLGLKFHCIYSGFLGSEKQISLVEEFIDAHPEALIVIDPVMGDDGQLYPTYTMEMCNKIKSLVKKAYLVTPNITECCLLLGKKYMEENIDEEFLTQCAKDIADFGPEMIVITGIIKKNEIWNFAYDKKKEKSFIVKSVYNKKSYSGTGDILSSTICGMILNGIELEVALNKATKFISKSIEYTSNFNVDPREGIMFEKFLKELIL